MAPQRAPISVIVPCYRCKETIGRAIRSVLEQTLLPQEILLVEDCSNDNGITLATLYALQRKSPDVCIKVISLEKNGGPAIARNVGWGASSQPYIAFLDADDSWHPKKIEIQYSWMEAHPNIVFCGHLIKVVSQRADFNHLIGPVTAKKIEQAAWLLSCRFSTISVMLRRDLPFRFSPDKRYAEDYLLWLTIILNGHEAWRLEVPLAYCFKSLYGVGGLTQNLWQVEKGELDTYFRIYHEGLISAMVYVGLTLWSLLKYLRRLVLHHFRGEA
jgi:glycosyltransferase involved in cell wall biosynthesis